MNTTPLPRPDVLTRPDEMYGAFLQRDAAYDGLFIVGVKTTGVFCRPTCPARKPLRKNVVYFSKPADALAAGYRACKRCHPLETAAAMPDWLTELMKQVDSAPTTRWTDQEIRNQGIEPARVARWFKANHGITFHGYLRCRRLAAALAQLSVGDDPTRVALDAGYNSLSGFRDAFQKWFGTTPGQIDNGQIPLMVNRIPTPLGPMVAAANDDHLYLLEFADRRMLETQIRRLSQRLSCHFSPGDNPLIEQTANEVAEYFSGTRQQFDVPFQTPGTQFQQSVWQQLLKIPYGQTLSYEQMAQRISKPKAQRAVGRANGDNRLAIIVPCHRVIRSDGSLSGYGGGVRRKEWMLQHEMAQTNGKTTETLF